MVQQGAAWRVPAGRESNFYMHVSGCVALHKCARAAGTHHQSPLPPAMTYDSSHTPAQLLLSPDQKCKMVMPAWKSSFEVYCASKGQPAFYLLQQKIAELGGLRG